MIFANRRKGMSLVEVIIGISLIVFLFGGIYTAYISILDVVANSELRSVAAALVGAEIELIRNLPYDQVGTQNGIPSGVLFQEKSVTSTIGQVFVIRTTVRNIDDPFDGTLGGSPADTAPADYKLVELGISCPSCARFTPLVMTSTVAPKSLESAASDGSLFVNVIDASGLGVLGATVQVTNASVTPTISLTDTTNASGVLQLVGVPTSTQRYAIQVGKSGYSSERTYVPGGAANPTPSSEYTHASVATQAVTSKTFRIDRLSTTTIITSDQVCSPIASQNFSMIGSKLIGAGVYKNSTSGTTGADGIKTLGGVEWDTYTFALVGSSYDLMGTIPFSPMVINPGVFTNFRFVLVPAASRTLLVEVKDAATGATIPSSTVQLTRSGFSETKKTARGSLTSTDWSGGQYTSESGGIETGVAGLIRLVWGDGGYSTTTESWLISETIDTGSSTSRFYSLSWNPESQPSQTSLIFQVATNNDNATWNFVGPDGTASSFYSASGQTFHASHANHRYLRYKVFMSTTDSTNTPQLNDLSFEFYGACVPPSHVLFQSLAANDYTVTASASGYGTASTSVTVSGSFQKIELPLTAQ